MTDNRGQMTEVLLPLRGHRLYRSHAPRGNAARAAPAVRDAERPLMRSHGDRGNEETPVFCLLSSVC